MKKLVMLCFVAQAAMGFTPPSSPRSVVNFNPDWKFIRQDVPGAEAVGFDDAKWETVSTPHTYNDTDTFDEITTEQGENTLYMGIAWYRKHFRLPAEVKDGKVFIEFEGMRQAGRFFVNGQPAGLHENGVTPCGLDITGLVKFGGAENVLAVKVDNRSKEYKEEATGVRFQWASPNFYPNFGGLNRNVRLHLTGRLYQTLPLYGNLQTTGIYVYQSNGVVTVESQVRNESGEQKVVTLSVVVVDADGKAVATLPGEKYDMVDGETAVVKASGVIPVLKLWDVEQPNLYDIYSILTSGNQVVDVSPVRTGFRNTAFRGGAGKGGVYLNGRFVYLKGCAQRSTDEWAGLGQAYPDWMHDFDAALFRGFKGNYIRWMHVAPQAANVRACDKAGIIEIAPAGDTEEDVKGRQWEQRLEAMRDTIVYFRNNPSILFWEAGNNGVNPEHLKQMKALRETYDPNGGRAMGCRTMLDREAAPYAEYFGVMIAQEKWTEELSSPTNIFRGFSFEWRDMAPCIETEDFRDEAARRFWDDYSPPHFGFRKKPRDTFRHNSETLCLAAANRYNDYLSNIITNADPHHARWSGYASIIWSDSNSHGRQKDSEVCRVTGKIDAVRLPKQTYHAYRVMQNDAPDIHIIGHWNYPATNKTIYVVSNGRSVELFVNGKSKGVARNPKDGFIFAFPAIAFEPGTIKAVGDNGAVHEIVTVGEPKRLKLTAMTGPGGFRADGSDVALIDFEVVDEQGRRCPTDEGRVDFEVTGPTIWRGGYNSGKPGSTNNKYLDTECGINRVAIRSTLQPGAITVKATRPGLESATVQLESSAVP